MADIQSTEANDTLGDGVGPTTPWTSEIRPDVTGASVVTAAATGPDGKCLTVAGIVVNGEEGRAPKRMCRRPPSIRYMRV